MVALNKDKRSTLTIKRGIIKGPKSGWIFFSVESRLALLSTEPGLTFGEVCQRNSQLWKNLTSEERQVYLDKQVEDKQRYLLDRASLSPTQNSVLRKLARNRRRARRQTKQSHVLSAYMQFVVNERQNIVAANPGTSFSQIGVLLGAAWRSASVETRDKYNQLYTEAKNRSVVDPIPE